MSIKLKEVFVLQNNAFKFNIVTEFLNSIRRYSTNKTLEEVQREYNHNLNYEVENWISKVQGSISMYLDREITYFFGSVYFNWLFLYKHVIKNDITDFKSFFRSIKGLNSDEYLKDFYCELGLNGTLTGNKLMKKLKEMFKDERNETIFEMLSEPQEVLDRIAFILPRFYTLFFNDIEEKVYSIMTQKVTESSALFEKNRDKFTTAIAAIDSKTINKYDCINFYPSYFLRVSGLQYINDKTAIIIYGLGFIKRVNRRYLSDMSKLLFKVLSDDKRVDILRLIAKRKWYGNELATQIGISTPTLSHHISKIFSLGVLQCEEGDNKRIYYSLDSKKLKELLDNAYKDIVE